MNRRFSTLLAPLWSWAILLILWAPFVQLGARALAFALRNPALWREVESGRGVWLGTFELCLFTAILSTILGVPLGFCLARGPKALRLLGAILGALPLGVPPVILAAPFVAASGKTQFPLLFSTLTLSMSFYPLVALSCALAVSSLPRGEEEAALLLVSPLRAWFGVLGRRIFPAILGGAGAVGALCAWEMGAPDLLSQPSFGMSVYRALNSPEILQPGESAARAALGSLGVPFVALLFLIPAARALQTWTRNSPGDASNPASSGAPRGFFTSDSTMPFAGFGALVLLISPGFIVWKLLTSLESWDSTKNVVVANDDALSNTLFTATFSAIFLSFAALFSLWLWRDWPRKWRALAFGAALLPGLFAPVLVGVALVEFWNRAVFGALYDSSLGMVIMGHFVRFFPLSVALLWVPFSKLNPDWKAGAQNLGASPLHTWWSIEIPILRGAIAGVAAILWSLCAGELSTSVLVHGPGGDTLAIPIFGLLHAGLAADVAALCLLLMLLCGGAMALALVFLGRKTRESS
ncbi:ABC-type Fe3+ transport system, permease component [Abditibacterium utsteinense]|uniref:ABC-type Fe3+ transport system, permease component n=1 Tax=Abditibacterium utsteinense TaxID=1960156 RepID=A0A2S8SNT9_9BACT|nr:iron ABC transporter permease [Abditibacterium utsteinense]PQV62462.1 ABC-type Fe3+ transport system, permease component [Abditibacterium utsteinense]